MFDRGKVAERVLRIQVYKKGTKDEFFCIAPEDRILLKTGEAYQTTTPTADMFVSNMYGLEIL